MIEKAEIAKTVAHEVNRVFSTIETVETIEAIEKDEIIESVKNYVEFKDDITSIRNAARNTCLLSTRMAHQSCFQEILTWQSKAGIVRNTLSRSHLIKYNHLVFYQIYTTIF